MCPQHWIGGVFFARDVSPCQKWWWSLLGREISCSQWEGPSMHSRCVAFFSFHVLGRGGRDFFSFFPASQCVCSMFLSSSQWVPNIFPNIFSIPPHFYPICLGKWCPPFTYIGGPKERNCRIQNRTFCIGESPLFLFFGVMGQSNWHVAKKNKSKELGRHLI